MSVHLFRHDDVRGPLVRARRLGYQARAFARLPTPVALLWARLLYRALRRGDTWAIDVACRPVELHRLLEALRGRAVVAEVGTAAAWTASALALAEPGRRVLTWDVEVHAQRDATLALLRAEDRARIVLHPRPGGLGPAQPPRVDAVFIDSSHEREETVATFRTWEPALPPGGVVAFHDWDDPAYPGVNEAIEELGLHGRAGGRLFVWIKPG